MVFIPKLPPVNGYVEVERNGIRYYKSVESGEIFASDYSLPTTEERLANLEANKADQTEVDAINAAIERGLSL